MRHTVITLTDDLLASEGQEVEATGTVTIGLNGKWYELDLCDDSNDALIKFLSPYLIAGRNPGKNDRPAGANKGKKYDRRSSEYYEGLREYCAEKGIEYARGQSKKAARIKKEYDDYLAAGND